jgi:sigma-54 dependent transcriptional regulator, acetoin dehydrogenase operon transcriptional activator AcoR
VDVLLVSATNANLDECIARGRFRPDLLFRLNTLEVTLPPLGERTDFADIARHLMRVIDPARSLTHSAIHQLEQLDWPGNIRELRNTLSRLTLGDCGDLIDDEAVRALTGDRSKGGQRRETHAQDGPAHDKLKSSLHEVQRAQVRAAYAETGENISKTARKLGVSRNTIYRTLRDHHH